MSMRITDYSRFISARSAARQPAAIRALVPFTKLPGMISLGAGAPNAETFPFASMEFTLKNGEKVKVDDEVFKEALNYTPTPGLGPILEWLRELQLREHKPPMEEFDIAIGTGSQDLIAKALEAVINPGDNLLIENPSYTGIISFLKSQPVNLIDVSTDGRGIIPTSLEIILSTWTDEKTRPRVLYTISTAGNPSGITPHMDRKKQVYEICRKYNVLILEDDPYYYLQFELPRIASYFSIDEDARVLRFDSMSKILAAGMRLGWVTGPKPLVERINLHTMTTNLQPSTIPQVMTYALLEKWGQEGFQEHVHTVSQFYRKKMDAFVQHAEKYLSGLAEWTVPEAGMFVWIKLNGIDDTNELITKEARDKKVLAVPGTSFTPQLVKSPYVRVSYSNVTEEQMEEALKRLAECVREASQ
ncbi:hypothetical protein BZG36_03543 [Bifiguratus adelaidae]|uniref:Aminotransferase class I/classII large domain-containing protein n=1 Tax=Bifiguratus adelaidae TaxID=1938954 RepID=A0A261XZ98_9FUNG|nr:hypothetical protein BZG36_03543 [Bifiguratus adelaidae]